MQISRSEVPKTESNQLFITQYVNNTFQFTVRTPRLLDIVNGSYYSYCSGILYFKHFVFDTMYYINNNNIS